MNNRGRPRAALVRNPEMDEEEKEEITQLQMWARSRQLAAVEVMSRVVHFLAYRRYQHKSFVNRCIKEPGLLRKRSREELMFRLGTSGQCRNVIRMGPRAFIKLCNLLKNEGGLLPTQRVSVEEQVAKFLHILSHNARYRTTSLFFHCSGETISRHFHSVLRALISLEDKYLQQPTRAQVSPEILGTNSLDPYFKDCIGAIGGTHVRVKVSKEDAARYCGGKDYPTIMVLAACSFDFKFTYVLPGWEGSASPVRILENALAREDKLHIPDGKYYLADGGYVLGRGLITPFRGVRYHLKEYSVQPPKDPRELFNLRHASLCSAIERAFGILKRQFPIIKSTTESTYPADILSDIVLACCILHNYLMEEDRDERLINDVGQEILNHPSEDVEVGNSLSEDEDDVLGEYLRNNIASDMWNDYQYDEA